MTSSQRRPATRALAGATPDAGGLARPGEFTALELGPLSLWPPVVLAPMAGVTTYPFRAICRRLGASLCVSEMVTARALVEGNRKTAKMCQFGPDESPRSLQLYGADPVVVGEAVRRLVGGGEVDHLDLNFGCPVRKVTSQGAGSALPVRPLLLARIVRAAVAAAERVPVTIKLRLGIDDQHLTFVTAGRIAETEGSAAVTLHARTAEQLYDGCARWEAIGELKGAIRIPVIGNGDIWEARDALDMMRATGCDGIMVGRGCLGRPWLFADLADAFAGRPPAPPPRLGGVIDVMLEHATTLADWLGEEVAMRAFRRHACWYTKGFPRSTEWREAFMVTTTLEGFRRFVDALDRDEPFPAVALRVPRGKRSGTQSVALPEGYLNGTEPSTPPSRRERRNPTLCPRSDPET